jgi:hypothetical protein
MIIEACHPEIEGCRPMHHVFLMIGEIDGVDLTWLVSLRKDQLLEKILEKGRKTI